MSNEALTETLRVRLSKETVQQCQEAAQLEGKSVSDWVRDLLEGVFVPQNPSETPARAKSVPQIETKPSVVPQSTSRMKSITLTGCGDKSGRDSDNSMSLSDAYASFSNAIQH